MFRLWRRLKTHEAPWVKPQVGDGTADEQLRSQTQPPQQPRLQLLPKELKSQLQSRLYKVPAEIRVVIWAYALGGETIHLEHNPTMMCHMAPILSGPLGWAELHGEERLSCGKNWAEKEWLDHGEWHLTSTICGKGSKTILPDGHVICKGAILGLLLSCKRIYWEAVPFLFANNLFDFKAPIHFLCFKASLRYYPKVTIRRIRMRMELTWRQIWAPDYRTYTIEVDPPVAWYAFRAALQDMHELQVVQLTVKGTIPVGCLASLLRMFDDLHPHAKMELEIYGETDELMEIIALNGSSLEVRPLIPWEDCTVTFRTAAIEL